MSKKLFILVQDNGDGSYSPRYTMNEAWIKSQEEKYNNWSDENPPDWEAVGVDADGFHYDWLDVPDSCTLNNMGISYDCAEEN